jgi:hypothetical protein
MPTDLLAVFFCICARHKLNDVEVAALAGIAPHTCRVVRLTRQLPAHERCRDAIAAFVARNRTAVARDELRMSGRRAVEAR